MFPLIPAILLPIVGLSVYIPLRIKEKMRPALLLKTSLSMLFILYSLYAILRLWNGGANGDAVVLSVCVIAGMVCGLLGDVWLDLKDIHHNSKHFYMFCGFSFFLVGHLFFTSGNMYAFSFKPVALLIAVCVGMAIALLMFLLEKPMKLDYGRFRPILLVYSFILATTTVLPILFAFPAFAGDGAEISNRMINICGLSLRATPAVFGAGMILFFLSDLVLSQIYFSTAKQKPRPIMFVLNYILYYGGQFTLAASLYFLQTSSGNA
ncbi:MAG: lysoplasmalogenase [Oscillospiraceae bacterium]|jgi:uncharacterized membrane protein YhhN|nr:lysoplasmalogenase [Oscillospiraceae bacterium]